MVSALATLSLRRVRYPDHTGDPCPLSVAVVGCGSRSREQRAAIRRESDPQLPEVSEPQVVRHYTRLSQNDRAALQRALRYDLRPPLSNKPLSWAPGGKVRLQLRRPLSTGQTRSPTDRDSGAVGALSAGMAHYLRGAVRAKCSILICGGTGAGKTTLLNALSRYISSRERVVTIEDSAELQLQQKHVVRLESRPPKIEGRGEVTIRDLVRNALRMRPDRIIIGEVRASEVLDMVQAMNTGHEGSMTTVHANGVGDAFTRLLTMLSMAGTRLSEPMMAQMIRRAIDVAVSVMRDTDGTRRISALAEITGVQDRTVEYQPVFTYESSAERSAGRWCCAGHSTLLHRFELAGYPLDPRWPR